MDTALSACAVPMEQKHAGRLYFSQIHDPGRRRPGDRIRGAGNFALVIAAKAYTPATPSTPTSSPPRASRRCSRSSTAISRAAPPCAAGDRTASPTTIWARSSSRRIAVFWGIAGFLVGVIIALQLAFPALNFDLPWITFGRLRPLHTSAVIFAFGGNVLIATSFYVVQRTCRARLRAATSRPGSWCWGYNFFIVLAGTGYLLGITQSQGICRARMVRRPLADDRLGRLSPRLPRHASASARNRTSTWPTGSTSPSS